MMKRAQKKMKKEEEEDEEEEERGKEDLTALPINNNSEVPR